MRSLFLVVAKLVGILAVVQAIVYIPFIAAAMSPLTRMPDTERSFVLLGTILAPIVSLAIAALLLFKTEKLADLLRVSKRNEDVPIGEPEQLLRVGLILIGVYLLISSTPQLVQSFIKTFMVGSSFFVGDLVSSILRVLLAMYVTLFSRRVIEVINKYQSLTSG